MITFKPMLLPRQHHQLEWSVPKFSKRISKQTSWALTVKLETFLFRRIICMNEPCIFKQYSFGT